MQKMVMQSAHQDPIDMSSQVLRISRDAPFSKIGDLKALRPLYQYDTHQMMNVKFEDFGVLKMGLRCLYIS